MITTLIPPKNKQTNRKQAQNNNKKEIVVLYIINTSNKIMTFSKKNKYCVCLQCSDTAHLTTDNISGFCGR